MIVCLFFSIFKLSLLKFSCSELKYEKDTLFISTAVFSSRFSDETIKFLNFPYLYLIQFRTAFYVNMERGKYMYIFIKHS